MSTAKFLALLNTSQLYFVRADKFEDPYEGTLPKAVVGNIKSGEWPTIYSASQDQRSCSYVNCWHLNNYESEAMWKTYAPGDATIGIRTTLGNLKKSFNKEFKFNVYLGSIRYIDYENDMLLMQNLLEPLLHKRKSFEHEKEIRAIINTLLLNPGGVIAAEQWPNHGINVDINLQCLLQTIFISPSSQAWYRDIIEQTLSVYGLECPVLHSNLDQSPYLI